MAISDHIRNSQDEFLLILTFYRDFFSSRYLMVDSPAEFAASRAFHYGMLDKCLANRLGISPERFKKIRVRTKKGGLEWFNLEVSKDIARELLEQRALDIHYLDCDGKLSELEFRSKTRAALERENDYILSLFPQDLNKV